jgi:hypothetical protein
MEVGVAVPFCVPPVGADKVAATAAAGWELSVVTQ